jgi:hypothetical protein
MILKKKIKTVIIGLGKVGLEYDYNKKNFFLTHSKALFYNKNFDLLCGVDRNIKQLIKFKKKYNLPTTTSIYEALIKFRPELVVISASTYSHYKIFKGISNFPTIKIIMLEKPGAEDFKEFKKIINLCKKNKIKLFINYFRLFNSYFEKILNLIKQNKNFEIIIKYNRGLFNNVSHYLGFLSLFLTNLKNIKIINKNCNFINDPQPDFVLSYNNAKVYFIKNNNPNLSLTDIEIIGDINKLNSTNDFNEFYLSKIKKDNFLNNYYNFFGRKKIYNKKINILQYEVYEKIYKIIYEKKNLQKYYKLYTDIFRILTNIKLKLRK